MKRRNAQQKEQQSFLADAIKLRKLFNSIFKTELHSIHNRIICLSAIQSTIFRGYKIANLAY